VWVAYLEPKRATWRSRRRLLPGHPLTHLRRLSSHAPTRLLPSIADLQRCRHIEPILSAQVEPSTPRPARSPLVAERCAGSSRWRGFLTDIKPNVCWPTPSRRLVFPATTFPSYPWSCPATTHRRRPAADPRKLNGPPPGPNRQRTGRLRSATGNSPACCAAAELLDLELDCVPLGFPSRARVESSARQTRI